MILDATTRKLQVVLGGARATADSPVVVDWVDNDATTFTPGVTPALTNGVTAVDILAPPAGSHFRKVNAISLVNADTAAITATFRLNDNATLYPLFVATLAVNEKVIWTDALGWQLLDTNGALKQVATMSGAWLRTTVKTTGTTFVTGAGTNTAYVRMVGGGGGGGGCASVASAAGAAGGGGAGSYAEKTFAVTPSTSYTIQVGAQGNGSSGAAGGNGTSSTFAVGATTVTAPGGTGGPLCTPSAALIAVAGGAGGAIATNGDLNGAGDNGEYGVCLIVATPVVASGKGGNGVFGKGGLGLVAVGAGNAAVGFGAGGGGSATGASVARAGGNGAAGVIIVDEYS